MADEPKGPAEPQKPIEPKEPTEPKGPKDVEEPKEPQSPFSPEQEQFLGSWMGRIISQQLDEKVLPHLKKEEIPATPEPPVSNDAISQFNEKVSEKLFSGDALGAFQMMADLQKRATENLTKTQKNETNKVLTSYADKPYYKDIYPEMERKAHEYIVQGYPPEAAAELAYSKSYAAHLESQTRINPDTGSLETISGGKPSKPSKKPTLPEHMKAQCRTDIESGLFKDEQEWIDNLSPSIRAQYGI